MTRDVPYATGKKARIGDAGRASERRIAKQVGGRLRPASGAVLGHKGDIALKAELLECKSTTARTMILEHKWLAKIGAEARAEGKTPVLTISFTNSDGSACPHGDWAAIPLVIWQEIVEKLRGDSGE